MSESERTACAATGGHAAGRDQYNTGRDQYVGISADDTLRLIEAATRPLKDQTAEQRDRIEHLQARLGTTEGILHRSAAILQEHLDRGDISFETLPDHLVELARQRQDLLARQQARATGPDDDFAELDRELADALAAGDDARAEALAQRARDLRLDAAERRREAAEQLLDARSGSLMDAAESEATLADLALGRLEYRRAHRHFHAAGELVPADGPGGAARLRYRRRAFEALYRLGDEFADNAALAEAISYLRTAVLPLAERPLDRAAAQHDLGNALRALGERETGTARLEEAVAAYGAALAGRPRASNPLDWAMTQQSLGAALMRLGERESGTARLEQAVAAYREALGECTRERAPLRWATVQANLGTALRGLAARESGTARLEEAVAAYRAALSESTRERAPLQWAKTQTNLATTLAALGAREGGTARLEEAVVAYRAAQEERSRERVPLQWAMTQMNLGIALRLLGERGDDTARVEEAVATYRATLSECTRDRVPMQWAMIQTNLGTALWALGERDGKTARRHEAVTAYRAALDIFARAGASHYQGIAAANLEAAEALLRRDGEAPSVDAPGANAAPPPNNGT
jgi:tetratricopeptide (TPR) repeat protein